MNTSTSTFRIRHATLACTVLASALVAQGPEKHDDGPFIAVPHGLSVDPMTTLSPADASRMLIKSVGFADAAIPPEPAVPAPRPDFRMGSIMQNMATPRPDVDAFSIGLDWILSDGDGVMSVPMTSWGGLSFSVERGSTGEPGSVIHREATDPSGQGAGGDLFFYILPDGDCIPPVMRDRTYELQDAADMDIDVAGAPATPEMDAHDLYVSILYADNPSLVPLLPPEQSTPMAFFSVSDATKGLVPTAWWAGTTPSGATVFGSTWSGTAWSVPAPYLLYSDLELMASEDVDAVAIDLVRCEVLFSTKSAARDEVLWIPLPCAGVDGGGTPRQRIYRTPANQPISERMKTLRTDDVDALCALDPCADALQRMIFPTPEIRLPWIVPPQTWGSVYRVESPTGLNYVSSLVGWPQPGRQQGQAACLITFPGLSPFITIASQARDLASPWLGDPRDVALQFPPMHPLMGFTLEFQWLVIDSNTLQFDIPYASSILL